MSTTEPERDDEEKVEKSAERDAEDEGPGRPFPDQEPGTPGNG